MHRNQVARGLRRVGRGLEQTFLDLKTAGEVGESQRPVAGCCGVVKESAHSAKSGLERSRRHDDTPTGTADDPDVHLISAQYNHPGKGGRPSRASLAQLILGARAVDSPCGGHQSRDLSPPGDKR